ncbi:MAG: glycosyltransferase [Christensenellaceae bacterium]
MTNILFAGNSKVFDGVLTCTLSILKRTTSKEPFTFYIFTMDVSHIKPEYTALSDESAEFLQRVVKGYNEENKVVKVDVTDEYMKEFDSCPNESAYCSPYTLIRLLADKVEIIPDKILYLDIDVMLNKDIMMLYNLDVEGYEYAATTDHYGKFFINPHYVNAGVLLLNMKLIKETGLFKKARELLKAKKLVFADQSAIIRSTTKRKIVSQRFNDQKFLYKNTVIRHFSKRLFWLPYPHTENVKQWHIDKVHKKFGYHAFDDIYEEYLKLKSDFEKN